MFCPNCGTQLPDDAVFCINCGASVANTNISLQNHPIPPEPEESASVFIEEPTAFSAPAAAVIASKPSRKKMWIILIYNAVVLLLAGGGT